MNEITNSNTNIRLHSPSVTPEGNLNRYLYEINQIPMLDEKQEYELAKSWIEKGDTNSAHTLVTAHLRLVAKIASGYRGYGLPYEELISEGNIGIMHAVKRFDPDKGARLSTYASWWIRASIQEYILHNWSLVKIGTTHAQKKLFFKLKSTKEKIGALEKGDLSQENLKLIASELDVSENEVLSMNRRMAGTDLSLNAPVQRNEETTEWEDWLESDTPTPDVIVEENQEMQMRKALLENAMAVLNTREAEIINARRLKDKPDTLETLSQRFDISKERIRQIETRAFEKLQEAMRDIASIPKQKPMAIENKLKN